jgi:uncharacterized membrane protein
MTLKKILQGRWMTHPLHPATVHMPLGTWLTSICLDAASLITPSNKLVKAADYANRVALFAAVPSVASGLADYIDIEDESTFNYATIHMLLNVVCAGLSVAAWKFRAEDPEARRTPPKVAWTQLGLLTGLLVTGYIGGLCVYEKGMRVQPLEPSPDELGKPVWEKKVDQMKEKIAGATDIVA